MKIYLFILVICTLWSSICCRHLEGQNSSTPIEIFENYQENIFLNHSQSIYLNYVASSLSSSKEVGISLMPFNLRIPSGELSIFFSTKNPHPSEADNNKSCLNLKMIDFCVFPIPSSENATDIYISFLCESQSCQFKWRLNHIEEIKLEYGKPEYFNFYKNEFEIFNITVPSKEKFSRLVFSVEHKFIPVDDQLKSDLDFSKGNPEIKHLADREIAIFFANDTKLCFDCNISITVFLPKNSVVLVEAWQFTSSTNEIFLNETVTDFLFSSQKYNTYLLNLDNSILSKDQFVLFVSFKSLSGTKKTLYVSVDNEIQDFSKAQWKSTLVNEYYEEEDIMIEKRDLEQLSLKGNKFYFYVVGEISGLYMIHTNINQKKFLPLYLGIIESGLILNDEVINYEHEVWKSDDLSRLTLSSTMTSGHLNLYVRKCEENNCALITKEDCEKNNNIQYKVTKNGLNKLDFQPECNFQHLPVCYYIVAIMGNSTSTKTSKYSLVLKRDDNMIVLFENVFHESHLEEFHSEVFKLIVEDDSNLDNEILSISFLINQDIVYSVSKNIICYDFSNSSCDSRMGNYLNPVIYLKNNEKLAGVYYLILLGTQRSNVLIYPRVIRKGNTNAAMKLLEGKVFHSKLMQNAPREYFKFHVSSERSIMIEINIHSSINRGVRTYLSKDGIIPSPQNYFLSSNDNYLSFYHSETDNDKIYFLLIESRVNFKVLPDHKIDFSLMYSTENSVKHLEPNKFFYDFIMPGQQKNFIFFPGTEQESIILSKHVFIPSNSDDSLRMKLSILLEENSYFEIENKNNIVINRDLLRKFCGKTSLSIEECPFYVTLTNDLDQKIHYNILLRFKDHSILLNDGKDQAFLLEEETKILMHYVPSQKNESLDIFSYSYGIPYSLYFKIFHNVNLSSPMEWPFDEVLESDIHYKNKNSYFITFNSSIFKSCWPDCVLLISLVINNTRFNIPHSNNHKVHIMVSSKTAELEENKPLKLAIEKDEAKYFFYDLAHFMSTDLQTIIIQLNNLYGTANLYITINDSNEERMPSLDKFDFISQTGNFMLTKTELNNLKKNLSKSHMIIGISCITVSCESSFILETTSHPLKFLLHGRQYNIYLDDGVIQRFHYFHQEDKSFKVKFNRENGVGTLKAFPCQNFTKSSYDECFYENVKNESNQNLNLTNYFTKTIYVNKEDPNYCFRCLYIISFYSISALRGTVNVILENEFITLHEGKKFLDEVEEEKSNLYMVQFPLNVEIKVLLNIYSGNPEMYLSSSPKVDRKNYDIISNSYKNSSQLTVEVKPIKYNKNNLELNTKVYVLVYGKENSNYSITYKTEETIIFLHEGLVEFDSLKVNTANRYVFEIFHQVGRPTLSINLKKEEASISSIHINSFFRQQKNIYDNSNQLVQLVLPKENIIVSENSIIIVLLNSIGHYEFEIKNQNNIEIFYSIIVNTNFINMVPYNTIINQIIPKERGILYETYAPNKGYLMFDILECVGEVKLFVSKDYESFKNQIFEEEFEAFEGVSKANILKVNKGMIYFALVSESKSNQAQITHFNNDYYKLTTHFYDTLDEIPENKISPGNNGRILWEFLPYSSKFKLTFEPLRCLGFCPDYLKKYLNISYWVLISKDENLLNTYGKCSIIKFENVAMNPSNFNSKFVAAKNLGAGSNLANFFYEFDYSENIFYVSIKAKIQNYPDNSEPIFMYYENVEIRTPPTKIQKVIYFGLTAGAICLVVLLGLCCFYYYRRYKKLEESLNYEIKDVDNTGNVITTLNASIEMQPSKRYQGLVEDSSGL